MQAKAGATGRFARERHVPKDGCSSQDEVILGLCPLPSAALEDAPSRRTVGAGSLATASQLRGARCSQPMLVNLQEQFACQGANLGGLVWQLLPLPGAGPRSRVCRWEGGQVSLPRTGVFWGCWRCPFVHPWVHELPQIMLTARPGCIQ